MSLPVQSARSSPSLAFKSQQANTSLKIQSTHQLRQFEYNSEKKTTDGQTTLAHAHWCLRSSYHSNKNKNPTPATKTHIYTSLLFKVRDALSATSCRSTTSNGTTSDRAFVPTSSRFRTLTDRESSSSCPTTKK